MNSNSTQPRVVATITGPWPHPVEIILLRECGYWRFLRRLLRASKEADIMVLRGTSGFSEFYAEAVAAIIIKVCRRRPPTIFVEEALFDFTSLAIEAMLPRWTRPLLPKIARLAVGLADGPHVAYGVISTDEERSFEARWGIEAERVYFIGYYATVPEELTATVTDGGYVFAGGNTHRDYELLVEAARGLDVTVKIASTWTPRAPLPPNVELSWMDVEAYNRRMAAASVIVVPLVPAARSAGQQTYLSAMLIGKPTIVVDAPGVRDYVEPGETALVVGRDVEELRGALRWVLDPANQSEVERLSAAGRRRVEERYLVSRYYETMWDAAVGFWEGGRNSSRSTDAGHT